ncbi:MAG: type II toxin-antitoxin system HipA family toxin [Acidimicrobiaceae bacterium]|nr:type II toxin-antitoxin system HipA family toxin [Acidimicrobiaceae bacterium]MYH44432.1 type II toxin-antitoxin system HipA family toxin [Acidimicrobiaceae bacterium]MYJ43237.1 type II toxin-antitoxin system HipA family toxin [Acidimicrobiaceae bacterium]
MCSPDLNRFVDALIFNWAVAATDAHAKNHSLLLEADT